MQRVDQTLEASQKLLNEAMMQVARGTINPVSVMGPHSLLEDMYGNNSRVGIITNSSVGYPFSPPLAASVIINPAVTPITGGPVDGQLIQFMVPMPTLPPSTFTSPATLLSGTPGNFSSYIGLAITFLNGPRTMGQTTRIVSYIPAVYSAGGGTLDQPDYFQIVATDEITVTNIRLDINDLSLRNEGLYYLINGAPFSGTGFGFDPNYPNGLNKSNTYGPIALQPNDSENRVLSMPGGANEDYDAADYQNMVLGAQIPTQIPTIPPKDWTATLPSMHRPALVNYWVHQGFSAWWQLPVDLQARIMLRPLGGQGSPNPDFTGGNPNYNPPTTDPSGNPNPDHNPRLPVQIPGYDPTWNGEFIDNYNAQGNPNPDKLCDKSWDVDNDGDGVADSIWVDLGMPARATSDGRMYKPLFAILCVDMDGRLNLNAHGSRAQGFANYYNPVNVVDQNNNPILASGVSAAILNRGVGFGPAEVNFWPLLSYQPPPLLPLQPTQVNLDNYYRPLLSGNGTLPGRYGAINPSSPQHMLSWNKLFQYRTNYWDFSPSNPSSGDFPPNSTYYPSAYGSPPDMNGSGSMGLDLAGRPLYIGLDYLSGNLNVRGMGADQSNLNIVTNPYELDLAPDSIRGPLSSGDNPFSLNELERILRPYDHDAANLPNRLAALTFDPSQNKSLLIDRRHAVTTESWDVPCPPRPSATRSLADEMIANGVPVDQLPQLLPLELLMGLKMNLNRPLGNGLDQDDPSSSTHVGVVDYWDINNLPTKAAEFFVNASDRLYFPIDPKSQIPTPPPDPRQIFARYLYILATQLVDRTYLRNQLGGDENAARFLAQWAVNAVDFCDRDSIMTRFDYDTRFITRNPFPTDWNPNWDGQQHIVWGCDARNF